MSMRWTTSRFGVMPLVLVFMCTVVARGVETQMTGGWYTTYVLAPNGTVWSTGENDAGQLGNGGTVPGTNRGDFAQIPGLNRVIAIAAGYKHAMALKSDGTVWVWGSDASGQLGNGDGDTTSSAAPAQVMAIGDIVSIAAGDHSCYAITRLGQVYAWGANGSGQLGIDSLVNQTEPVLMKDAPGTGTLTNVQAIAAGQSHAVVLLANGAVVACGADNLGQVGNDLADSGNIKLPTAVFGLGADVTQIACGWNYTVARMKTGQVNSWGQNNGGTIGDGTVAPRFTPYLHLTISKVKSVSCGWYTTYFLLADGTLQSIGFDGYSPGGALGDGAPWSDSKTPVTVTLGGNLVRSVAGAGERGIAALADGQFMVWGHENYGALGNGGALNQSFLAPTPITVPWSMSEVIAVDAGRAHTLALKADGTVWSWGANDVGQLGNGNSAVTQSSTPLQVAITNVIAISSGSDNGNHVLALRANGSVWGWGANPEGQLGNNATAPSVVSPVQVKGVGGVGFLANKVSIAAGDTHSLALDVDGKVFAWGKNDLGQLGDTTINPSSVPVTSKKSGGAVDFGGKMIAAGADMSLVLTHDGKVFGWGSNAYGKLARNAVGGYAAAGLEAMGSGSWIDLAAGSHHVVARNTTTNVIVWGKGDDLQLPGYTGDQKLPQTLGWSYSRKVGAGAFQTFTGQVWGGQFSCGQNDDGQLGVGSTTDTTYFSAVGELENQEYRADGGRLHAVFLSVDGTVWCAGNFGSGRLGTTDVSNQSAPVLTTPAWLPQVSITATDNAASEPGANTLTYTVTRSLSTISPLVVQLTVDPSSSVSPSDFQAGDVPATITIPSGSATATFVVRPTDDYRHEPTERLTVQLVSHADYRLGTTVTASGDIADNDPIGITISPPYLGTLGDTHVVLEKDSQLAITGKTGTTLNFTGGTDLSALRAGMIVSDQFGYWARITSVNIPGNTAEFFSQSPTDFGNVAQNLTVGQYSYFSLKLTSQPSGPVTIPVRSSEKKIFTLSADSITIDPDNWIYEYYIAIYPTDDDIDQAPTNHRTANVTFPPMTASDSQDPDYIGISASPFTVTCVDEDVAGIRLSKTTAFVDEKSGGNGDEYSIRLATKPATSDPVTVTVAVPNGQCLVAAPTYVFDQTNWDIEQLVKIVANPDDDVEGGHSAAITHASTSSMGSNYIFTTVQAPSVNVTIFDDDFPTLVLSPATLSTARLQITEQANGYFTVRLGGRPISGAVALELSCITPGVTVSPPTITILAADWNVPIPFTVTQADDGNTVPEDFDIEVTTHDGSTTADAFDLASATAYCRSRDEDIAHVQIQSRNASNGANDTVNQVTEGPVNTGGDWLAISLSGSAPALGETVAVAINTGSELTVDKPFLIFTAQNTPQFVQVFAANDAVDEGATYSASLTFTTTSYGAGVPVYGTVATVSSAFTVTDNDVAGISISPTSGLVTSESGGQANFSIVLTSQPTTNVTVPLTIGGTDANEGSFSSTSFVMASTAEFTPSNWSQAQTIAVYGYNDADDDGDRPFTVVTGAVTAGTPDPFYLNANPADVQVTNLDDDTAAVIVSATNLAVTEGAGVVSYNLTLATRPTGSVTITVQSGAQVEVDSDNAFAIPRVNSFTFTTSNWDTAQPVYVRAKNDDVAEAATEQALLVANAAGGGYGAVSIANIIVTVTDNDTIGFLFDASVTPPSALVTTEAGTTASYTFKLRSQPIADVEVQFESSNSAEVVFDTDTTIPGNQDTLIFTLADWNVPRTITATGVKDQVVETPSPTAVIRKRRIISADTKYVTTTLADVSITNTDINTATLVIAPTTGLTTDEEGAVTSIAVTLSSQPTSAVLVTLASQDTTQGVVDTDVLTAGNQDTLVFTPETWSTAQTVRIIGADGDGVNNSLGGVSYQITVQPLSSDDGHFNTVATAPLTVINLPANAAPTLTAIADVTALENVNSLSATVTGIGSGQTGEVQALTMTVISSNTALIADPIPLVAPLSVTTASINLALTPVHGQSGSTLITISLTDDDAIDGNPKTTISTFRVTIAAVNDAPVIDAVLPVTFDEDSIGATVPLTGIGSGSPFEAQSLTVTAVSGNTALIQTPLVTYVSPSFMGSLQIVPVANISGDTTVTVTVRDDGDTVNGGVNQTTLVIPIHVLPVNDPPTISALLDHSVIEDAPEQIIALSGITSGAANEADTLTVTCTSANTALIPTPTVTYASPESTGSLRFTPAPGQAGSTTLTVTVSDGHVTVSRSFVVAVSPINDPPVAVMSDAMTRQVSIGSTYVILPSDLTATDADAAVANPDLVFTLLLVPGAGELLRDGVAMQIDALFTQSELAAGKIAYHHLGGSGTSDGFAYVVTDLGIPANSLSVSPPLPVANLAPATSAPQVFSIVINRQKPSIVLAGTTPIFVENQANGILIADLATVEDGDSPTFADGEIRISLPTAIALDKATMTLSIRDQGSSIGEVSVVGSAIRIRNSSNVLEDVGSVSGGQAGSDLVIACSVSMTPANAQRIVRNLRFATTSDHPPASVSVSVIIRDAAIGDTSTAAMQSVGITPVNDLPTWTAALVTTVANQSAIGRMVVSDPDHTAFTFTVSQAPVKGVLSAIAADGTFTYTPALDLSGNDQFTVIVSDGIDAAAAQAVAIRISGTGSSGRPWIVSDPPVEVQDGDLLRSTVLVSTRDLSTGFDVVFSLVDAPAGMTIVESAADSAVLTWTAVRTGGDHLRFRIRATESASGATVDQPVLLFVHPATGGSN